MSVAEEIAQEWRLRLREDGLGQEQSAQDSIVQWLMGETLEPYETMSPDKLQIVRNAMEYRYRILRQRYWNIGPEAAYRRLIKRLSSLFLIRSKVKTWIALSRDRRRTVVDVLQEVLQEMIQSDRHLVRQLNWIARCTGNHRLRSQLTLACLEEYCLRPIRNQPLIVYRFVNYLRKTQKGGMTQVPTGELVRLVSDEISAGEDGENAMSLLDIDALATYQEEQSALEEQRLREQVKTSFMDYLIAELDATAAQWLDLHLKGYSQDAIAKQLSLPIKQVYRLREKVSYHAIRVFTLHKQPDLVFSWLKTSLKEHNFGLTPAQWDDFWQTLSPDQQALLREFQAGKTLDAVAQTLKLKPKQVQTQWAQLYMDAQALRSKS